MLTKVLQGENQAVNAMGLQTAAGALESLLDSNIGVVEVETQTRGPTSAHIEHDVTVRLKSEQHDIIENSASQPGHPTLVQ